MAQKNKKTHKINEKNPRPKTARNRNHSLPGQLQSMADLQGLYRIPVSIQKTRPVKKAGVPQHSSRMAG